VSGPADISRTTSSSIGGDAQKGLYYSGTTLGKSKILSVGASFDSQEDYSQYSIDAHWDQPLGGGNAITASAAYSNIDGDDFLPSLAEQENIWLEAGFYFAEAKLLPFVQYAERDYKDNGIADSDSWQIGIGYMFRGHAGNVKLSYSQSSTDAVTGQVSNDVDTIWLNLQAFKF
jgi:hypothetical protein